ncbi:hypothetical protein M0R45_025963 [Rubus argutus]|uniref:Uncharacterized protein n=1 Tax=Rubus argutus TaxID=59490 RepID=A0AAW1WYM2_RUBAR
MNHMPRPREAFLSSHQAQPFITALTNSAIIESKRCICITTAVYSHPCQTQTQTVKPSPKLSSFTAKFHKSKSSHNSNPIQVHHHPVLDQHRAPFLDADAAWNHEPVLAPF